jgi:hypothetical protein
MFMSFSAPAKLFFAAATLFLAVVAIGVYDSGFEPKAAIGLVLAGTLARLGFGARTIR